MLCFFAFSNTFACDLSYLQLNGVTSLGGNQYQIDLTYCVGSGRNSSRYGADQNSAAFAFKLEGNNSTFVSYPASFVSPNTGATYSVDYQSMPDWVIYSNYTNEWWACIDGGCGPVQSTCISFSVVTQNLPGKIVAGGAEAANIIVPPWGCNGQPDMEVNLGNCLGRTADAGPDQTVYVGWAPAQCATLSGSAAGGLAPYTYAWSTGATTASINVCPSTTTTYTLTTTDALGCTATDQVTVTAQNVTCGNGKILVCHSGVTKCLAANKVQQHLNHGDYLGTCTNKNSVVAYVDEDWKLVAYPNPANDQVTVEFGEIEMNGELNLFSMDGRKVFGAQVNGWDAKIKVADFPKGIYFLQYTNETISQTIKLVVQ